MIWPRPPLDFACYGSAEYRLEYRIFLDEDEERLDGWGGRFRKWRLGRRQFLSFEEAAYLFTIGVDDIRLLIELDLLSYYRDTTRKGEPLSVHREDLDRVLLEPIDWDRMPTIGRDPAPAELRCMDLPFGQRCKHCRLGPPPPPLRCWRDLGKRAPPPPPPIFPPMEIVRSW